MKDQLFIENKLRIRRMRQADYPIMMKWLNDPHVSKYYEGAPISLEQVIDKYKPRIEDRHYVKPCIVEYQNNPIGYIQYYQIPKSELEKYDYSSAQLIFGIDQFIGVTELWGKGFGTSMIRMILNYLMISKGAAMVLLDVKKTNTRAIASYEKCGFQIVKSLDADSYLMEWGMKKEEIEK
ncbi:GNAT family N-acetyltransferase [Bacillus sp. NEB1478]|uniref:GNAT family N-acetyltransferase n=1 Tax=Bacillus sp. NEB1478 TaxID=3073816 RepID=UPI002873D79A|nr:GNAT family N-acetyltransferase [Bacillus sp. NEB1478]WNB91028.1 GNAT family N-acetyltransferase [Bacillus sp. NEB1478]